MAAGLMWSVTSASAAANIVHRYNFNEAAGATVADSVGGATGNLMQISEGGAPVGVAPALDGTKVTLDGAGGYVDLPNGLISAHTNVTLEFWVTWDGTAEWERIFAFGCQTNNALTNAGFLEDTVGTNRNANGGGYLAHEVLFATANYGGSGGAIRVVASDAWWTRERPVLNDTLPVFGGTEFHFVVTYGEGGARMFYDGLQTASGYPDPAGPLPFLELPDIVDVNNWLGRAQYNDPMYAGSFNEFRIHNTLLSAAEVYASYNNFSADTVNYDPGASSGLTMTLKNNMIVGGVQEPGLTAFYSNLGATIDIYGPDLDSLVSDNTNAVVVAPGGVLQAVGVGSATITATLGSETQMATITVAQGVAQLKHRYSLTSDVTDSVSGANGTVVAPLAGGAAVSFAGGEADFPGGSYTNVGYIALPGGLLSVMTNVTIETWFTWDGPSDGWWQRVFDFGNSGKGTDAHAGGNGLGYIMLTMYDGDGIRAEARSEAPHVSELLEGPAVGLSQEHHAVVVYAPDASISQLYLDGIAVDSGGTPFTLDTMVDQNMWLGVAQWNDPPLDGRINELRIHEGILNDLDVAISGHAGPDDPNPGDPGSLNSVSVPDVDLFQGDPATTQATLLGTFDNYTNVNISGVSGVLFEGQNTNVVTVTSSGVITQVGAGTAPLSGSYSGVSGTGTVSVLEPISTELQLASTVDMYGTTQGALLANYNGYTNVDASGFGVVWTSLNPSVATVSGGGLVTGMDPGTATISAAYGGVTNTSMITVGFPGGYESTMNHRYSFTTAVEDSVGTADGSVAGTATVTNGQLVLDGAAGTYADLPPSLVVLSNYTGLTLETWATPSSATATWAALFSAGQTNSANANFMGEYLLFQTHRGDNTSQFGMSPSDGDPPWGSEDFARGTEYNDNAEHHYVGMISDGTLVIFADGVLQGTGILNNAPAGAAIIANQYVRVGTGYPVDGFWTGSVNELRIYEGILTQSQVAANFVAGPDTIVVPAPPLTITAALPNVIVSWPTSADGFTLEAAATIDGTYSSAGLPAPVINNGNYEVTVPATSASQFFRLSE